MASSRNVTLYLKRTVYNQTKQKEMRILLRTISGKTYDIDAEPSTKISELKKQAAELLGVIPEAIIMISNAKILQNDASVEDAGLEEGKAVILHIQNVPAGNAKKADPKQKKEQKESIPKPILPRKEEEKACVSPVKKEEKGGIPHSSPLPMYEEKRQLVDPPNFDEMVDELVSMGFDVADCMKALRAAVYNPNRAADFLLTNYIPELPHLFDPAEDMDVPYIEEEDFQEYAEEEDGEQNSQKNFLMELHKNPDLISVYLQDLADNNPAVAPLIRSDPAAFLVSIGLNPKDFDLTKLKTKSEFEMLMDQFTEEQQQSIHRLEKLGFDTTTVIQVYDACGRDEELTASCLQGMK